MKWTLWCLVKCFSPTAWQSHSKTFVCICTHSHQLAPLQRPQQTVMIVGVACVVNVVSWKALYMVLKDNNVCGVVCCVVLCFLWVCVCVCVCVCVWFISSWAEAHIKIARMTLTIKLDRNWNSFQLANSAPPLSVTDSAIAPSARINELGRQFL